MKTTEILIKLTTLGITVATAACTAVSPTTPMLGNTEASLPPKYLNVPQFNKCLGTKEVGTIQQWCLPSKRMDQCPEPSWEQLRNLTGRDRLPDCQN